LADRRLKYDFIGDVVMRCFALVALLVVTIPAFGSGPQVSARAEPAKPQYDGINHKNFAGNMVGLQLPKLRLPFVTSRELITLLCPDVDIPSRLLGDFDLPSSGFSFSTSEVLRSVRDAILPNRGVGQTIFEAIDRNTFRR
jgi:hypothetical protein